MQTLTAKRIAKVALKNWDNLGAVNGQTECFYAYSNGNRCVIGAALNDDTLAYIIAKGLNTDTSVSSLLCKGIVNFSKEEHYEIGDIQAQHDIICQLNRQGRSTTDALITFKAHMERLVAEG